MTLSDYQREHVTPAFYQHTDIFKVVNLIEERNLGHLRWTIDWQSDFTWLEGMLKAMKVSEIPEYEEVLKFLTDNPNFNRTQKDVTFV
jgi:spore coat polysaccharide biosynthesis protein SpsF (cytidylyltransferase family)